MKNLAMILGTLGFIHATTVLGQSQEDCGARCLFTAIHSLDPTSTASFSDMIEEMAPDATGLSFKQVQEQAEQFGFRTLGVETSLRVLQHRKRPFACIAHLKNNHFVLITHIEAQIVRISDPPEQIDLPHSTFLSEWDGSALLVSQTSIAAEEDIISAIWWKDFLLRALMWGSIVLTVAAGLFWLRRKWQIMAKGV